MKRSIFFILLSLCILNGESLHAMHKKSPCSSSCSCTALKLCCALCIGCLYATVSFNAHHAIVDKTKAEYQKQIEQIKFDIENPCLEVSGTNPALGNHKFTVTPPLCDIDFDTEALENIFNKRLGIGTRVHIKRGPCQSSIVRNSPAQTTITQCTHDVEEAIKISADIYNKRKQKTD